jgi:tetratricopeptide (TPR) repeat protein
MKRRFTIMPTQMKRSLVLVAALLTLAACNKNVINRANVDGEKIINTCDSFKEDINALMQANANNSTLVVAQNDNTEFAGGMYLEPGQFEVKNDTLYFRLMQDLDYRKYMTKGVAIHVDGTYKAQEHLRELEEVAEGKLGTLIIDLAYFQQNGNPYFLYKIPADKNLSGKSVHLTFSVMKYKNGQVKKVFCNTVEMPLGPIEPACCNDVPWEYSETSSVIQLPDVKIPDQKYRYKGFIGFMDMIFAMNSDVTNKEEMTQVINRVGTFDSLGYKVTTIDIKGYASQGGTEDFNLKLSDRRVKSVGKDLEKFYTDKPNLTIEAKGYGEDWDRFAVYTKSSNGLTQEDKNAIMDIYNEAITPDEKEAKLRTLACWDSLVSTVLVYCRHTFVNFNFEYKPDMMYTENYPTATPVLAPELMNNVAMKQMTVARFKTGEDIQKGLKVLNMLINNNKKPNLYAMRSTYYFGNNDITNAIKDIESAIALDKTNNQFALTSLAYKTQIANSYTLNERIALLDQYNEYTASNPGDKNLAMNRVVMLDKIGFISGALSEYDNLLKGDEGGAGVNNRGVAKLKTNRFTEAEVDFMDAIDKDPKLAEPYFNLALIYAYRGLPEKTAENLDRSIALNSRMKGLIASNPVFNNMMTNNPEFGKFK